MAHPQKSECPKLGNFPWEQQDPEQLPSPEAPPRPWYRRFPAFAWERVLQQKHTEIFNDKALDRKFTTESGNIENLGYREPCIGTSSGTPAAGPPTCMGWYYLTSEEVWNSDDLKSTEGFVPTLKRAPSKGDLLNMESMASKKSLMPDKSPKSKSAPLLPSIPSSQTRVNSVGTRRHSQPSSSRRAD